MTGQLCARRLGPAVLVVCATIVTASGCELITDKLHEAAGNGAGPAPSQPGTPGNPGVPTPPSKPVPPPPDPALSCGSTAQCPAGLTCSTDWGVCHSPPGCKDGPCPAVCYGTCEKEKPQCVSDADCRLTASYCEGCSCLALGPGEPAPKCSGMTVACFADPCLDHKAVCLGGRCAAQGSVAPSPPRCQDWQAAGDENTCKSQDEWKSYAYEACKRSGLYLNDYGVGGGDCAPGKTNQVKFQCCGPVATPPTSPPPPKPVPTPTPPSAGACTGGSEGGATSCKTAETWKSYVTETCARNGLTLVDMGLGESCGRGSYRYVKYTCCTPSK